MSERILQALMQLFAIIAKVDISEDNEEISADESSKNIVKLFLQQDLTSELVSKHLTIFDDFGTSNRKYIYILSILIRLNRCFR